jgi:hypothetical protein
MLLGLIVLLILCYHALPACLPRLREATAPVVRFAGLSVLLCGVACVAVVGNPSLGG